jgi:hypothetical protein
MFPIWDADSRQRIKEATLWVEQWKGTLIGSQQEDAPPRNPGFPHAVRGVLLQDIWGGQVGKMQCLQFSPQRYSFMLSVVGKNIANPVVASPAVATFKIKVFGVKFDDSLQELFTTTDLGVEAVSDAVNTALVLGAQGVNLPVKRTDVQVQLGNPGIDLPFVSFPRAEQNEVDKTVDPPETYTGTWFCTFSGAITNQFKGLTAEIVPVQSYILTSVVPYPVLESLSDRIISVRDIYYRPQSYPWKVGSIAAAIYFPDSGFGLIGSNFHDMAETAPNQEA